jgi:hypothetical protein
MRPGESEIECVTAPVILNDVTHRRFLDRDVETLKHTVAIQRILDRLIDEYRMRHCEPKLGLYGPRLLDTPRNEYRRPRHLCAARKRKTDIFGPLFNLLTEGGIRFICKLKLGVLLLSH